MRHDVVVVLNYYVPYVSGLTETARRVAEGLARKGRRVMVVTSRHDPELPSHETIAGVQITRCMSLARVSRGIVSLTFPLRAIWEIRRAKVALLHLPMLEAGAIALGAGRTPLVVTYHCDVTLSGGIVDRLATRFVEASARMALRKASAVVVSSLDYARSSPLTGSLIGKSVVIAPPCLARPPGSPRFREGPGPHIGFLGRVVAEKGLEYLVEAFRQIEDANARLLIAGVYKGVAGGSVVDELLGSVRSDPRIRVLGHIPDQELSNFYASLDVFVLPSTNSLEAFGISQVEAMLAGVPVVATDLPGARVPVLETGFGVQVPPRDARAIALGILSLLQGKTDREVGRARARARFDAVASIDAYDRLLQNVATRGAKKLSRR